MTKNLKRYYQTRKLKQQNSNYSYPKSAYICFFTYKEDGKKDSFIPNPEIVDTLESIKLTVNDFNSTMKKEGKKLAIHYSVAISTIDLIDLLPYNPKKWNNPNITVRNVEIVKTCYKLLDDDYTKYKILIAPWSDYREVIWNTVQSVYKSSRNEINWKTLLHSDRPIADKTEYIGLYKCRAPEVYYPSANIIATMPPVDSDDDPIVRKV